MADLIDPDPAQPGEQITARAGLGGDTRADRADRAPGDPHQLGDRPLGALDRQPRRLVLKAPGKARRVPGPRHRAHDHAMLVAAHPRRVRLDVRQRGSEVKRPPPASALAEIEPRATTPTHSAAILLMPPRPRRDNHLARVAERHVLNDRGAQPEQPRPYAPDAHVAVTPFIGS
jgi:hypothetical protein